MLVSGRKYTEGRYYLEQNQGASHIIERLDDFGQNLMVHCQ